MKTKSNDIHLTINTYPNSFIKTSQWTLREREPERIAARFKGKEFVIVLDKQPYFEVWSLDSDGELQGLESTYGATNK